MPSGRGQSPDAKLEQVDLNDNQFESLTAYTDLQAQKLASLTARSFNLCADPPTVCVDAGYSKHRRTDVMPLADDLVERVRLYLAERMAELAKRNGDDRIWPGNPPVICGD